MHTHLVTSRRRFLASSTMILVGGAFINLNPRVQARRVSPNDKLNIGVVGVANQGRYNLDNVSSQNIVALCDVDANFLNEAAAKHPSAQKYRDFRKLIAQKDIDAIVVATPDHTHAVITAAVLKSGRHAYCEKPLTHTLSEARYITQLAAKQKLVTQIGTQIHAGSNYRRVVELIRSGAIGAVKEVHVWVGSSYGNVKRPTETPPEPSTLDYDLWVGPVEKRPYHPDYLPFKWRNWWAFGGGSLADFGCHFMDLPHWALDLRHPLSAQADGPTLDSESTPTALTVRYKYPARGAQPAVDLTWYHGGRKPSLLEPDMAAKWGSGVLFIGSKGQLISDYGRHLLFPEKDFAGFVPPAKTIPESIGHHAEWILACKTGGKTTCSFDYSGPLTEAALLGNLAYRVGKPIDWDSAHQKARGNPGADALIQHQYRKGWKL